MPVPQWSIWSYWYTCSHRVGRSDKQCGDISRCRRPLLLDNCYVMSSIHVQEQEWGQRRRHQSLCRLGARSPWVSYLSLSNAIILNQRKEIFAKCRLMAKFMLNNIVRSYMIRGMQDLLPNRCSFFNQRHNFREKSQIVFDLMSRLGETSRC